MDDLRLPVAVLSISAAGLIGVIVYEGYKGDAYIPTRGDVPTIGFGSTVRADGSKVAMGDRTTPVEALKTTLIHLQKDEAAFRGSLPGVLMTQAEYDLYLDFVYQYGMGNWLKSSMRRELLANRPQAACDALLLYRRAAGRDCSLPQNRGPDGCKGVWTRQQERHQKCVKAVGNSGIRNQGSGIIQAGGGDA
ncbi:MAG: lysozyme [Betaproteobacteria bacterium]|nr:lysozyme [Betaproteobacteria bacterium]